MKEKIGSSPTNDDMRSFLWSTLRSGQVIPGFGHAVLRKPDPRFEALMTFAAARPDIQRDPTFKLVKQMAEVAPVVLTEHGKVLSNFTLLKQYLLSLFSCSCSLGSSNLPSFLSSSLYYLI